MERIPYDEKSKNIILGSLAKNSIPFYQFYNVDFNPTMYGYEKYKREGFTEYDFNLKTLNKTYYDIEVFIDPPKFPDAAKAERPVNAIASYNTILNKATVYYLYEVNAPLQLHPEKGNKHVTNEDPSLIEGLVQEAFFKLVEEHPEYEVPGIQIEVLPFNDEIELLVKFFEDRRNEGSLFLIGFNSEIFDDPYMVNRLFNMVGKEKAAWIISEFGEISSSRGKYYSWPDTILVDILSLYKPVDAGGSGFGKSLPNYKLETIAEAELGITKLELPGGFNENYLNNIVNYLAYNLIDTILVYLIDRKKEILELQWSINNYNKSIMSSTMAGRSLIYTTRNNLHFMMNNKLLRYKRLNNEIYFPGKSE